MLRITETHGKVFSVTMVTV